MFTLNCKGKLLTIEEPVVMGIINSTPDSFYQGSRKQSVDEVLFTAEKMIGEGVTILDVGGQSTRPGSAQVSEDEELKRVIPSIEMLARTFPGQIISVDSFYSTVAKHAIEAGASIINDVSGGGIDRNMFQTIADLQVPYVLMHIRGKPATMQSNPFYENVVTEVFDQLNFQVDQLRKLGVHDIIIDPGFGFGKTIAHNFRLLNDLLFFRKLGLPLMAGLSRKATVYKTLDCLPEEALNGTTVIHTIALMQGADILRAHDVKEAMEAIKMVTAYKKEKEQPGLL
ncbi:MAG: dihydropteroate synthase [Flavisolibacter sp.]|jgi:dihydropteroate synthase|nr:dihydropteroate synthase [Flavisolibacter sp.]